MIFSVRAVCRHQNSAGLGLHACLQRSDGAFSCRLVYSCLQYYRYISQFNLILQFTEVLL
jgi:hypothetical protein